MKYVRQFFIIAAVSLAGEALNAILPLPVPASIYGVVLLFLLLLTGALRVESVKEVSAFLIEIMPLMFIPAGVALLGSLSLLASDWVAYAVILVVSTVAVMAVSGLVTQALLKKDGKEGR